LRIVSLLWLVIMGIYNGFELQSCVTVDIGVFFSWSLCLAPRKWGGGGCKLTFCLKWVRHFPHKFLLGGGSLYWGYSHRVYKSYLYFILMYLCVVGGGRPITF
jgi:hypothetical protein